MDITETIFSFRQSQRQRGYRPFLGGRDRQHGAIPGQVVSDINKAATLNGHCSCVSIASAITTVPVKFPSPSIPRTARVCDRPPLALRPPTTLNQVLPEYAGTWSTGRYSSSCQRRGRGSATQSPAGGPQQSGTSARLLPVPAAQVVATATTARIPLLLHTVKNAQHFIGPPQSPDSPSPLCGTRPRQMTHRRQARSDKPHEIKPGNIWYELVPSWELAG